MRLNDRDADICMLVDCGAIVANYRKIQARASSAKPMAVVKANAYGLGVEPVANALFQAGCRFFFVATLEEAVVLRTLLPQVEIAYFHGPACMEDAKIVERYRIIPVVNSRAGWEWVGGLPCILHVDTGMNRLGLSISELQWIRDTQKVSSILYIMTHPACADDPSHPLNARQLEQFSSCLRLFPGIPASYANSYALFSDAATHFQAVRPGCALYGINPSPGQLNPMQPVVTLYARILQLRVVDCAGSVGYGATHSVLPGSVLATIACGYADGYLYRAADKAFCVVAGSHVPIVGRISMDLMVADVTSVKKTLKIGDKVELIGRYISVDEVAQYSGTIGYEVLTRLGNRCRRVYTNI